MLLAFRFHGKMPMSKELKTFLSASPLPKFIFIAELTEKRNPWCPPELEDSLRVTPNAATSNAQALLTGGGGVCSGFPELPALAHIPPLFNAIPRQILPETRHSSFFLNPPTELTSETVL